MTASTAPHSPEPGQISTLIRPARPGDAQAMATLHVRSWQQAYARFMPADYLATLSVAERTGQWLKSLDEPRARIHVACVSGGTGRDVSQAGTRVAGFCMAGACRDIGAAATDTELWAFYVDPADWSKGVGLALWRETLHALRAAGPGLLSLWVIAGNERAIRFYRRAGFAFDDTPMLQAPVGGVLVPHRRMSAAIDALPVPAPLA